MDKCFLLIVMQISIQMLPTCLATLFSAASLSGRHAQQYLNRIIDPKVDSLFVIPYIVVKEVISPLSRNDKYVITVVMVTSRSGIIVLSSNLLIAGG